MKLSMLKLWQNSLIRENCNTFIVLNSTILSMSRHDIEKSDTALLHCISGTYLWGCSIILKMIFNSSYHSTIFIIASVSFTLRVRNCPTHKGKTKLLNRVTSFIFKFNTEIKLTNLTLKSVRHVDNPFKEVYKVQLHARLIGTF